MQEIVNFIVSISINSFLAGIIIFYISGANNIFNENKANHPINKIFLARIVTIFSLGLASYLFSFAFLMIPPVYKYVVMIDKIQHVPIFGGIGTLFLQIIIGLILWFLTINGDKEKDTK